MAETLVTQYAGTVDNDNLPKLGELRFSITPAQNTNVRYNLLELSTKAGEGDVVVSVIGNGYITDANRTANLGTSKTIAAGANMDKTYFSNGTFTVVVSNKYAITALVGGTGASVSCNYKNWSFDIEQLRGMSNLTNLQFHTSGFYGDIISLSSLTNLEFINLRSVPNLYGDISSFHNLNKLTYLYIVGDDTKFINITGDIAVLSKLTNLQLIGFSCTNVYGDISSLRNLSNLGFIFLSHTSTISGDIANLDNLGFVNLKQYLSYLTVSVPSPKTDYTIVQIYLCPNIYGDISVFSKYGNFKFLI